MNKYLRFSQFLPTALLLVFQPMLMTSWRVSYSQMIKEEKLGLVSGWFCMICWQYFNVDDHSIVVPLKGNFKGEW